MNPGSLTISFHLPEAFFEVGKASLTTSYQFLLATFFPRYVKVLKQFEQSIDVVSIEGHSSSEWNRYLSIESAYLQNMALSQRRTRAVLEYCLLLPTITDHKEWLRKVLSASGLSSSRPMTKNGLEDNRSSRRVDFRIMTKQ